jgi:outer membrane protein OmpA-like peptidoglycan-associated protein
MTPDSQNGFYQVFLGSYDTRQAADAAAELARSKGFKYASVFDQAEHFARCASSCRSPIFVRNIFFDFDQYDITSQAREDLDNLSQLLFDFQDYTVKLSAHTDAKGGDEYNVQLSRNRAEGAKNFLIRRGVEENRITIHYAGELEPIAKNTFDNGSDSPEGRLFNRRVEVAVFDKNGKLINSIVEPIDIPLSLKL